MPKLDLIWPKLSWNLILFASKFLTLCGQKVVCPYIMSFDMSKIKSSMKYLGTCLAVHLIT